MRVSFKGYLVQSIQRGIPVKLKSGHIRYKNTVWFKGYHVLCWTCWSENALKNLNVGDVLDFRATVSAPTDILHAQYTLVTPIKNVRNVNVTERINDRFERCLSTTDTKYLLDTIERFRFVCFNPVRDPNKNIADKITIATRKLRSGSHGYATESF